MTTIQPAISTFTINEISIPADRHISFDQVGLQNSPSLTMLGGGVIIREKGIYEVTYGVSSKTGGLFWALAVPGSIGLSGIIPDSKLYVHPNTTASITFLIKTGAFANIVVANGNIVSRSAITLDGTVGEADPRCKAVTAYMNVKKISNF